MLNAQSWAPIGAKWYYSASAGGLAPTGSEYYLYEVTGEEMYRGILCKRIDRTYYKFENGDTSYLSPFFTYESNDTVYYYNNIYDRFLELYIFCASKGDTLTYHITEPISWYTDTTFRIVLDSISDYITGADTLEYFHTTPLDDWWFYGGYIQKIGTRKLMLPSYYVTIPEADGPLRCYEDSSIQVKFLGLQCDYRLTSSISNLIDQETLKIYPNPAKNCIKIEYRESRNGLFDLIIFDLMGQKILEIPRIGMEYFDVDIGSIKSGMYIIRIYSNGQILDQSKFLIEKW